MEISLNENEILEKLDEKGLKIVQDKTLYRFSRDSVLLANFCEIKKLDTVVELCSGSGIISFLIYSRFSPKKIIGFENDKKLFELSKKSVLLNNIKNVEFFCEDLKKATEHLGFGACDDVVINPPYYEKPKDTSKISQKFLTAKYESSATLKDILKVSSSLLKNKGNLFLIYPTSRIQELLSNANEFSLVLKKISIIQNKNKSEFALFNFRKNANDGCLVDII